MAKPKNSAHTNSLMGALESVIREKCPELLVEIGVNPDNGSDQLEIRANSSPCIVVKQVGGQIVVVPQDPMGDPDDDSEPLVLEIGDPAFSPGDWLVDKLDKHIDWESFHPRII
jgi:hypothetical protein